MVDTLSSVTEGRGFQSQWGEKLYPSNAIQGLILKDSEGADRIPQRLFVEVGELFVCTFFNVNIRI